MTSFHRGSMAFAVALFLSAAGPLRAGALHILVGTSSTISGHTFNNLGRNPSLNASGTVAFTARDSVTNTNGVYTQYGIVANSGDTVGGDLLNDVHLSSGRSINAAGTVVFTGNSTNAHTSDAGESGIYTQYGVVASPYENQHQYDLASINDNGAVTYVDYTNGTATLLLGPNGMIANTIPFVDGGNGLSSISRPEVGPTNGAVFYSAGAGPQNGASEVLLANIAGGCCAFLAGGAYPSNSLSGATLIIMNVSVADDGGVAYEALIQTGPNKDQRTALYTVDGGLVVQTALASEVVPGGRAFTGFGAPSFNDGMVAYLANFTPYDANGNSIDNGANDTGIFTGNGVPIVLKGDVIDGHTVVSLGDPTINANGDIAFWALFDSGNGPQGIVYYDAASVPEPGYGALAGMIMLAVVRWRRQGAGTPRCGV